MRRVIGTLIPAMFLLVACGSGKSSVEVVTGAPAKTTEANTAEISEVIEITPAAGQGDASATRVTGEGTIDFANRRAKLTVHVGEQSIDVPRRNHDL